MHAFIWSSCIKELSADKNTNELKMEKNCIKSCRQLCNGKCVFTYTYAYFFYYTNEVKNFKKVVYAYIPAPNRHIYVW